MNVQLFFIVSSIVVSAYATPFSRYTRLFSGAFHETRVGLGHMRHHRGMQFSAGHPHTHKHMNVFMPAVSHASRVLPFSRTVIDMRPHLSYERKLWWFNPLVCGVVASALLTQKAESEPVEDINASKDGWPPLQRAVYYGGVDLLRMLLNAHGIDVDRPGKKGITALMIAVDLGKMKHVEALLQHGASVDKSDENGDTPLHKARGREMVEFLLNQKGIEVNKQNKMGLTALHMAVEQGDSEKIRALLSAGADGNKQDADGATPLVRAVRKNDIEMVQLLVAQSGVCIDQRDRLDRTPFIHAIIEGNIAIAKILRKAGADVNATTRDNDKITSLRVAIYKKDSGMVEYLLSQEGIDVITGNSLSAAIDEGQEKIVGMLIKHKNIDVNNKGDSFSPLFTAFNAYARNLFNNIAKNIMLLLIRHKGIQLDEQDAAKNTILHLAIRNGWWDVAATLIEQGADANIKDAQGKTPLQYVSDKKVKKALNELLSRRRIKTTVQWIKSWFRY